MKRTNKRWKVFVIVLCMLFTMSPGAVFADEPTDPVPTNIIESSGSGETENGDQEKPDDQPGDSGDPGDPATPPGDSGDPEDQTTPPGIKEDPEKDDDSSESQNPTGGGIMPAGEARPMNSPQTTFYEYGTLTITKEVLGKPESVPAATFTFKVEKKHSRYPHDWYFITSASIVVATGTKATTEPIEVRTGTYRVTEDNIDDYSITTTPGDKDIKKNKNTDFEFENTYIGPTTGSLKISKEVECESLSVQIPDQEFEFAVSGPDYTTTVALRADQSVTLDGLAPGSYTVTESPEDNFTPADGTQTATVAIDSTAELDFINYYEPVDQSGSITVLKEVFGDAPESLATFNIRIQGDNEYSGSVTVSAVSPGTVSGLEPGIYTLTEDPYSGYTPRVNPIQVTVTAGGIASATFVNDYADPIIEDPVIEITKKVAEYNGVTLPPDTEFVELLKLNALNKTVLFKIKITCNEDWSSEDPIRLVDLYQGSDVTNSLLVENGGVLTTAAISGFPDGITFNYTEPITLYYQVTLPSNGTYTNTASIYESQFKPQYRMTTQNDETLAEMIDSASAIVEVNYKVSDDPPSGGGGGGGGSAKYYDVTYNPNYPSGTDTSGKAPVDSKNYRYNNVVDVRGNTGQMKAGDYIFKGWNTKPDGTGTMYQSGSTFNIKEDTVLYAIWEVAGTETVPDTPVSTETNPIQTSGLDEVPKTGDETPIMMILLMGLLSFVTIAIASRRKKTAAE